MSLLTTEPSGAQTPDVMKFQVTFSNLKTYPVEAQSGREAIEVAIKTHAYRPTQRPCAEPVFVMPDDGVPHEVMVVWDKDGNHEVKV